MYSRILASLPIIILVLMMPITVSQPLSTTKPLWFYPMPAYDIAISNDGAMVAVASNGVYVYNQDGDLLWHWPADSSVNVTSIDMTGDGDVIVAAIYNSSEPSYRIVFWKNAGSLSGTPDPDWISSNIGSIIGPEALAVSDNGNYVVAVGTGNGMYFWNNTLSIPSGSFDVFPDYTDFRSPDPLEFTDISSDGMVIVVAGLGTIIEYLNLPITTSPTTYQDWIECYVKGLDLSNDGSVFAYTCYCIEEDSGSSYVVYMDAFERSILWVSVRLGGEASALDMSEDGEHIVVSTNVQGGSAYSVYVFHNASEKEGYYMPRGFNELKEPDIGTNLVPEYVMPDYNFTDFDYPEDNIFDVSISNNGGTIAFGTGRSVYILNEKLELHSVYHGTDYTVSDIVKVSGNGRYVATCGDSLDSVYYFRGIWPVVGGEIIHYIVSITDNLWLPIVGAVLALGILLPLVKRFKRS